MVWIHFPLLNKKISRRRELFYIHVNPHDVMVDTKGVASRRVCIIILYGGDIDEGTIIHMIEHHNLQSERMSQIKFKILI